MKDLKVFFWPLMAGYGIVLAGAYLFSGLMVWAERLSFGWREWTLVGAAALAAYTLCWPAGVLYARRNPSAKD